MTLLRSKLRICIHHNSKNLHLLTRDNLALVFEEEGSKEGHSIFIYVHILTVHEGRN